MGKVFRVLTVHAPLCALLLSGCGGGSAGGSSSFRANDDTFDIVRGGRLTIAAPGVMGNDSGATSATAALISNVAHGTLTLNGDGSFTYQHDGGNNDDSFVYQARSGSTSSNNATVALRISSPTARNSCHSVSGSSYTAQLSATGDGLVYEILTQPAKGSLSTDPAGNFNYSPRAGGQGLDQFTFRVRAQNGELSDTATVSLFINGALRIMPLGDSITLGTHTATTPPDGQSVGYRRRLYNDLASYSGTNFAVDFVGSRSDGTSASPAIGDPNHEGWGGGCAGPPCDPQYPALSQNVRAWLDGNPADFVLLHAGINDLNQRGDTSASGIAAILDEIDAWEAARQQSVTVYVARIIKDVPAFENDLPVTVYNDNVAAIVAARPSDKVVLVDMENGANLNYGNGQPGPDMADNYHPTASGYDKMAAKWFSELTNRNNPDTLPECP